MMGRVSRQLSLTLFEASTRAHARASDRYTCHYGCGCGVGTRGSKFNADTVQEFMTAVNKKFGGQNLGKTNAHPTASFTFDKKAAKLTKVVFTCPVTEDFAEVGGGKPDKANKDAIQEVAARAEAHEEKHNAGFEAAFK